jgi:tetratricopeptide (TPR) repeat protein
LTYAAILLLAVRTVLLAEPDAQTLFREGLTAVQQQRLSDAEQAFRKVVTLEPNFTAARKNLGTVLWFLNRHAESAVEFRKVTAVTPQDPVPHLYLGLAAVERRDFLPAVSHFEKAGDLALKNPETRPAVLQAYLGAAEQYDAQRLPEKALAAYQQALRLDPDAIPVYLGLAAFASAHGNYDYARKALQSGLRRQPNSAELLLEQGIVLALQGLFAEAEASFQQSAQIRPNLAITQLARGVTQLQRGQAAEAVVTLRAAAKKWPGNGRARYLHAVALERSGDPGKVPEAIAELRAAIGLNAKDGVAHALLGRILLKSGKTAEAAGELETAARLDPGNETSLYQLAAAYRTLGRAADAQKVLAQFRRAKARARASESELVQLLKIVRPE